MKIYRVKETPIYKKGKLYKKGEVFPFDKSDKILLEHLTVEDKETAAVKSSASYPDLSKEQPDKINKTTKTKTKQ